MGWDFAPTQKKRLINFLHDYNVANRYLKNVINVTIVNKFELLSAYEYICIAWEFPMRTAKLHVSRNTAELITGP